jgi:kynureninase
MTLARADLERLDTADPLAGFRERFVLPPGVIYLDGNSLGALPRATADRVARVVTEEWGRDLISSWNTHDWIDLPQRIGDKIGRLIGAAPGQVVAADSTSVNLFKVLSAALALRPDRKVILSDRQNFPTDLYVAQGLIAHLGRGHELRVVAADEVEGVLGRDVAVLMLTQVDYRSGRLHDMTALTRAGHEAGALVIWDLAHSAGVLPVALDAFDADFAIGCGYKYLNGGPGAPAFLYVAHRLQAQARQPLTGWMGHAAPFSFDLDYRPADDIRAHLCGTPVVLGMAALEVGVDLALEADMRQVRAKSVALTESFLAAVEHHCPGQFELASPREPERRGSQICLRHPEGYAIVQALIADGVIGDFRAPDILRFGMAPLYLRHAEMWEAAGRLARIMREGSWQEPRFRARARVT